MERYDNIVKIEEIRKLTDEGQYQKAVKILDTMDLHRIKSLTDLSILADVLTENERYDEAMELLGRIYEKSKTRRVIYQMVELSIKQADVEQAEESLLKYQKAAPNDSYRFIFRYYIDKLKGEPAEILIESLEQLKEFEYIEVWAYELAKLYHKAGLKDKCVRECSDIILWFGDGLYVEKAKLLKAYYVSEINPVHILKTKDKNETRQRLGLDKTKDYTSIRAQINEYLSAEETQEENGLSELKTKDERPEEPEAEDTERVNFTQLNGSRMYDIPYNLVKENSAENYPNKEEEKVPTEDEDITEPAPMMNWAAGTAGNEDESTEPEAFDTGNTGYESDSEDNGADREAEREPMYASAEKAGKKTLNPSAGVTGKEPLNPSAGVTGKELLNPSAGITGKEPLNPSTEGIGKEPLNPSAGGIGKEPLNLSTEESLKNPLNLSVGEIDKKTEKEAGNKAGTEESIFSLFEKASFDYQKELGGFLQSEEVKNQFRYCLESILSDSSNSKFLSVTGEKENGKSSFALKICKGLYYLNWIKTDKIAKITGDNLNRVDILKQKDRLGGSSLIIENPGRIQPETAQRLYTFFKEMGDNIFVILEGTKEEISRFLAYYPYMGQYFAYEISLAPYTVKQLVYFAKRYLESNNYKLKDEAKEEFTNALKDVPVLDGGSGAYGKTMRLAAKTKKAADARYTALLGDILSSGKLNGDDLLYIIKEDIVTEEI